MEDMLTIEGLRKEYPCFTLDNISFTVPGGSIVGLIGENGAGKSTTINSVLGLIKPDGGSVSFWGGKSIADPQLREDIGVVFENICFQESLTPAIVGKISSMSYSRWDAALYESYLSRFGLDAKKQIKSMSRGMKMKLSIAVVLSHHPRLLVLDEATGGLDPVMRDDVLDVFLDFVQDENHAILMSSHITDDLEKIADYICFIHKGKLLFCKNKDALRYSYGIIRCGAAELAAIDMGDILALRREEYSCSVLVGDKTAARRKYPALTVDDAGIEDIMLMYVKGEAR